MGRHNNLPSYYPPRARWYSGAFYGWHTLRRRLWLDRIHLPTGVSIPLFLTSLLIPGWGFRARGGRVFALPLMGACIAMALAFIVFLGQFLGNIAFGLLLATHTVSLYYLVLPILMDARYRFRLLFMLILLLMMGCAVYMPIRDYVQSNLLMPLSYSGKVVIINRRASTKDLRVGDIAAYRIESEPGNGHNGVVIRSGYGLGPVLAVGGDTVLFTKTNLLVNGVAQPSRPEMPTSGGWSVPEKHWFIWPEFGMHGHGNVGADAITAALLTTATVPQYRLVGKPFTRWFHRRQLPL